MDTLKLDTTATPATTVTPSLAGPSTKLAALCSALQGRTYIDSKGTTKVMEPGTTFMGLWSLTAQTLKITRKSLSGYKAYELYNSIITGKPVLDVNVLAARNQENAVIRHADAQRIEAQKVQQLGLFDSGIGALIVKQTNNQIAGALQSHGLDKFTPQHMDFLDKMMNARVV